MEAQAAVPVPAEAVLARARELEGKTVRGALRLSVARSVAPAFARSKPAAKTKWRANRLVFVRLATQAMAFVVKTSMSAQALRLAVLMLSVKTHRALTLASVKKGMSGMGALVRTSMSVRTRPALRPLPVKIAQALSLAPALVGKWAMAFPVFPKKRTPALRSVVARGSVILP